MLTKHLILIGFKNTGKSVLGYELAKHLHERFVDLDKVIEAIYADLHSEKLNCRQIMQARGEDFFRQLEHDALQKVIEREPSIISLGGGTPLNKSNQKLIKPFIIIHITAPRGIVFERIMVNGRPAFFLSNEDPFESFNRIWDEREMVYKALATFTVDNNGAKKAGIEQILTQLDALS
jgi:shikimate kinase